MQAALCGVYPINSNISKYYIAYRLVLESRASTKETVEKIKGGAK